MTPEHVKQARRIIGKRWYNHYRAWKMHTMYRYTDQALCEDRLNTKEACRLLMLYSKKEEWYIKKLNNGQRNKR